MSEINFNSIYDGVSLALHTAFPTATIHGGEVKQGLKAGDFNVLMPGASQTKEVGARYKRAPIIDVIYYPVKGTAECLDIAQQLSMLLSSIKTPQGDIVHATANEWKVDGCVLHVLLRFDHMVYVPQTPEYMETLKIEQKG